MFGNVNYSKCKCTPTQVKSKATKCTANTKEVYYLMQADNWSDIMFECLTMFVMLFSINGLANRHMVFSNVDKAYCMSVQTNRMHCSDEVFNGFYLYGVMIIV